MLYKSILKIKIIVLCCHGNSHGNTDVNASLRSVLMNYQYFMLNQCLENMGEGLLHACISSNRYSNKRLKQIDIEPHIHIRGNRIDKV